MSLRSIEREGSQIIMHTDGFICSTVNELAGSPVFTRVVESYAQTLQDQDSPLLDGIGNDLSGDGDIEQLVGLLRALSILPLDQAVKIVPGSERYLGFSDGLHWFVEGLYDYWRSFDRYMICHSEKGTPGHDRRPYRTFNSTVEQLTDLVRALYRDICENITGEHPRVYRQVAAGCEVGLIAVAKPWNGPKAYSDLLDGIPIIRHVLINPPLILNPPMNKRTGAFTRVDQNPLKFVDFDRDDWLCYPARVGSLLVLIYFSLHFFELGFSLCNLFELADDEVLKQKPDAIFMFGLPDRVMRGYGVFPTVFHEDEAGDLLVGAIPLKNEFGYFGYLKKMALTLHNIKMMKMGRMPFHGALVNLAVRDKGDFTVLIMGDTGAGKSETLEALRTIGGDELEDVTIIADDMGSLEIDAAGNVLGYGTETGAFVRLDDLQTGYAFGQIDRTIIMSPDQTNARVVLPVTTYENIVRGYPIDFVLYANNYEPVDEAHPTIQRFASPEEALEVFRAGKVMSKGTTSTTGLVQTFFANVFGPQQYPDLYDGLAKAYFAKFFENQIPVGQMRTQLGISGQEHKGPEAAARDLLAALQTRGKVFPRTPHRLKDPRLPFVP